jgi:radical SAM-linked protein
LPARRPEGPPPPPVVQRLRIRYSKRDRLRFTSHRDVARAFERAVRRADLPIAFSAGFTPHPKISWLGAAPTGVASEAEYVEIGLAAVCDVDRVAAALDASLPPGLDILDCVEGQPGSLADRIDASIWDLEVRAPVAATTVALDAFMAADQVMVARRTKDGKRDVDARGAVAHARLRPEGDDCAIIQLVVRQTTPAVRPDDVVAALRAVADFEPVGTPRAVRLEQGRLGASGALDDPLKPDRAAGSPNFPRSHVGV